MSRDSTAREWLLGAVVAGIASLFALYASEGLLRLLRPDPAATAMRAAARRGQPYDERTRDEVLLDLRAKGVDAVTRTVPAALLEERPDGTVHSRLTRGGEEFLPLAGISRKTVVLCNETGRFAVYESDERGFRNPLGLWNGAPADAVLIGDSFTEGECVAPGEDLGSLLRARLPRTLNLGVGGHGPLLELGVLREYARSVRPAEVLWFYFENDLWWFDLGKQGRAPLLLRYLDPEFSQGLAALQPEIDALLVELAEDAEHEAAESSPVQMLRRQRGSPLHRVVGVLTLRTLRTTLSGLLRPPPSPVGDEPPNYALFSRVLERARDDAAAWGGRLTFVYLPGVWNFDRGFLSARTPANPLREHVLEIADALGLNVIDMQPVLAGHAEPLSLYSYPGTSVIGPPHLNAAGYAAVAAEVLRRLPR